MNTFLKKIFFTVILFLLCQFSHQVFGQERCGTNLLLEQKFELNPTLKQKLDLQNQAIKKRILENNRKNSLRVAGEQIIPVVFHVVINQDLDTAKIRTQIIKQLEVINEDFGMTNANLDKVLLGFKEKVGSAGIRFVFAQRDNFNNPFDGINFQIRTKGAAFDYQNENVKHEERGGINAWNSNQYLNVWVCSLANSFLGYATFPDDGKPDEQGVVIDFNSLPGGNTSNYSEGKTLTHELGHFFNLIHIWGDDNGGCKGSDEVEDTPNQANSSSVCYNGIKLDACTDKGAGIMYQNFMDYTPDVCLLFFTNGQVDRMRDAITNYRSSLLSSNVRFPPENFNNDASLTKIISPIGRVCEGTFTPKVTIKNEGIQILKTVDVLVELDNIIKYQSTVQLNLSYSNETTISLESLSIEKGEHILKVYVKNPNGLLDGNSSNDFAEIPLNYFDPFEAPITEGFESEFPASGWDIVNSLGSNSWKRTTTVAKTGKASAAVLNNNISSKAQPSLLRSPTVNIANVDSAFVSFQFAASSNAIKDSLEVLVSLDCGLSYIPIYKKSVVDPFLITSNTSSNFVPINSDWRPIELNLGGFIKNGEVFVAFKNTAGNQNNIYLDDIRIHTVTVNPNLKEAGFLVTPNPAFDDISVQFFPHPTELKSITLYNSTGQKVSDLSIKSPVASNIYSFDLRGLATGLYIVKAVFADKVVVKKFIKY